MYFQCSKEKLFAATSAHDAPNLVYGAVRFEQLMHLFLAIGFAGFVSSSASPCAECDDTAYRTLYPMVCPTGSTMIQEKACRARLMFDFWTYIGEQNCGAMSGSEVGAIDLLLDVELPLAVIFNGTDAMSSCWQTKNMTTSYLTNLLVRSVDDITDVTCDCAPVRSESNCSASFMYWGGDDDVKERGAPAYNAWVASGTLESDVNASVLASMTRLFTWDSSMDMAALDVYTDANDWAQVWLEFLANDYTESRLKAEMVAGVDIKNCKSKVCTDEMCRSANWKIHAPPPPSSDLSPPPSASAKSNTGVITIIIVCVVLVGISIFVVWRRQKPATSGFLLF